MCRLYEIEKILRNTFTFAWAACTKTKIFVQNALGDHKELRKISDAICREHGLSVLENSDFYKHEKKAYWLHQQGKKTHRDMLREDVEYCLTYAKNWEQLRNNFNRPFQASAMTLLLKNRKYIGDYCYGDTIIPGGVPALVEKDVFERVQRRMEANKKSPGRAKAKEEYLLSGKVFCGTCGGHMVGECGKSRNGTFYYYYKCINAKHGHTCKRKALKRDWLERAVVVETVTKVLTDEVIDRVADAIIAIQGQENPMIPSIKEQLRVCDKGLKNLLKAIEAGIFTPTTKERMEELERQKDELNISLIRAQMAQPVFTKEEIVKWISRFKYGNINDKAYQREMIDTFLNSVYVYDDKIVFTYNFRDHAETVTLDEIEYVFCSDVNDCPPPINPRAVTVLGFLLRKNPSDLSDSLGFFLVGFGCNPAPAVLYWTGISS